MTGLLQLVGRLPGGSGQDGGRRQRSRTPGRGAGGSGGGKGDKEKDKGHQKTKEDKAKELCNLFNDGRAPCIGSGPCAYGRQHLCRKCGGEHPAKGCDGSGQNGGWDKKRRNRGGRGGKNKY